MSTNTTETEVSYDEGKLNIIKNAFQTRIVDFVAKENKITFQYTLNDREKDAITGYLGAGCQAEIPEKKLVTGTVYRCTKESFLKLKNLFDSITEGKCPKCNKLGKFVPPARHNPNKNIVTLNFICPYGHTFAETLELKPQNVT